MKLPAIQSFHELDGEEAKEVLRQRFDLLLSQVPFLQRHLTLPRVRMTLIVNLELFADQPTPELLEITDDFTVQLTSEVDTSRDGKPPDQVRDEHGLPIHTAMRGDRATGSHIHVHDEALLDGKRVVNPVGLEIDRTGTGGVTNAGMAKMENATVVNMDQGPAGLRSGGERSRLGIFKNERS